MSLPNRLQNINNNASKAMGDSSSTNNESDSHIMRIHHNSTNKLPVSLDTSEEEGQLYLDITKYVATSIAKYKMSQLKQFFSKSLHENSQYNEEGFQ